jgi:hypothetical protein
MMGAIADRADKTGRRYCCGHATARDESSDIRKMAALWVLLLEDLGIENIDFNLLILPRLFR